MAGRISQPGFWTDASAVLLVIGFRFQGSEFRAQEFRFRANVAHIGTYKTVKARFWPVPKTFKLFPLRVGFRILGCGCGVKGGGLGSGVGFKV